MSFSNKLTKLAESYIQEEIKKPFLVELLSGNLPIDKFKYYIKVDYPYLFDFSQILALGIYKSDDLESMKLMVRLLDGNMREMGLHESYVKKFGISPEELNKQKMGPVKYAYTRHELAIGQRGSLGELLAALMPCMWGYGEIARRMIRDNPIQPSNPYKDWFDFYSSEDFGKQGKEGMELIDRMAKVYSDAQLKQIESSFLTSCYFEVVCWDAYYAKEDWHI
jgi:thiaminase/transcriptional activator TenA